MAKLRSGADMIDDAYRRADTEGADDRHPRDKVLVDLNLGAAQRYDLMVSARGKSYFRSPSPWTFTTTSKTNLYTDGFPETFYQLLSVRVAKGNCTPILLDQTPEIEEALWLDQNTCGWPTHYDLRPGGIMLYPVHEPGLTVTVEWIPVIAAIADSDDLVVDGVNGWEEYEVCFAAKKMALKDGELDTVAELNAEMKEIAGRISTLTPKRDNFRPRRVQDARGARLWGRLGGR